MTSAPFRVAKADRLPLWVIALLLLALALRLVDLRNVWVEARSSRLSQALTGQIDDQTMQATISVSSQAKSAYAASLSRPGGEPDPKTLRSALKSAEVLQKGGVNAPSTARRVIVLRALLHQPLFGPGSNKLDPRAAFQPEALKGLRPEDRARYQSEGKLWENVARGPHLTPAETDSYAKLLQTTPGIRWWQYPALSVLYQSQGNAAAAKTYAEQARSRAILTLAPVSVFTLAWVGLGLAGIGLLIYFALRRFGSGTDHPAVPDPVWPTLRDPVPPEERRLRAGDLLGVFALYLLMPDLLGWLLGGVPILHFKGLIAPLRASLEHQPAASRVAANIGLTTLGYLVSAGVPIGLLVAMARRRRASFGDELGWNTHRLGQNLLYGVMGYAVALPLVLLATAVGSHLHTPDPSNPAIPLLANSTSLWTQAMLVLLATVAAPLTEELLFRGVFLQAAKLRLGVWPAIVLTGFVFGFVHPVGLSGMLPLMVLGGVFAWMAETRRSLAPSMLAHCLQNTFATLMVLLALAG